MKLDHQINPEETLLNSMENEAFNFEDPNTELLKYIK